MSDDKKPGMPSEIIVEGGMSYDPQIRVDVLEVPGLKEPVLCTSIHDAHYALKELVDEAGVVREIYESIYQRMSNIAAIRVQLIPQADPRYRMTRACSYCGGYKWRLADDGKIACKQCGETTLFSAVFEKATPPPKQLSLVETDPPEVPRRTADLVNELLTEARDHIFRAAQELEQTDPSYRRLWEFAEGVEDEKIKLLRRCKECP